MKKKYTFERHKDFGEWFKNRGIGGSSVSALFNENPYLSKLDIYLSSINPKTEPPTNDNESTTYGKNAEPLIRKLVALNFSGKFTVHTPRNYEMYRSTEYPYLTATLDGIMTDKETKEKWILEIKTREISSNADEEEWKNKLPNRYFIQCLHYLGVMNDFVGCWVVAKLRWVDFDTGYVKKEKIHYYKILRKDFEKDIEIVRNTAIDFVENHILTRCPPDIDLDILRKEETNE